MITAYLVITKNSVGKIFVFEAKSRAEAVERVNNAHHITQQPYLVVRVEAERGDWCGK